MTKSNALVATATVVLFVIALILIGQAPLAPSVPDAATVQYRVIERTNVVQVPVEIGVPIAIESPPRPTFTDYIEDAPRCYEDEVIVLVVGQVQPDNGAPPDVDFAPIGDMINMIGCVPADNLPTTGNRP